MSLSVGKPHQYWFYFSGFNITIIAALFTFLFTRLLGISRGAIVSAVGIILYSLMVGTNPAVLRVAILGMFTLLDLYGWEWIGRIDVPIRW